MSRHRFLFGCSFAISGLACVALNSMAHAQESIPKPAVSSASIANAQSNEKEHCLPHPLKYNVYNPGENWILNPDTSLAQRQELFAKWEKCAQAGNWEAQNFIGSLYLMGSDLPGSFVQKDMTKARLYLSDAATHGNGRSMAKMAEIEIASRNFAAAMIWAQILGHYSPSLPSGLTVSDGYIAELLGRIQGEFDDRQWPQINDRVKAFIAMYNAQIKSSADAMISAIASSKLFYSPSISSGQMSCGNLLRAGFAEYAVAFKPDGTVAQALLLDAVPDPVLGKCVQSVAEGVQNRPAAKGDSRLRYALVTVVLNDQRYALDKASH